MSQCGACEELPSLDSSVTVFMVTAEGLVVKPEKRKCMLWDNYIPKPVSCAELAVTIGPRVITNKNRILIDNKVTLFVGDSVTIF